MGWRNPPMPWAELERRLTGRDPRAADLRSADGPWEPPEWATGGDSPAWSRKRPAFEPPEGFTAAVEGAVTPYAELHCRSNFSFLQGAAHPDELAVEAARLGLEALAITDRNGLYGVVRAAEAARAVSLPLVFGAEITVDGPHRAPMGDPDPPGDQFVILARDPQGYADLARAITDAQLAGEKGAPRFSLDALAEATRGRWAVLTGGRQGPLARALHRDGPAAAARVLDRLVAAFGIEHVHVELWDHGDPLDGPRNDVLATLALRRGCGVVATGDVRYAAPHQRRLAAAVAAVGSRRSLATADGWQSTASGAHLRSGAEQARRFARYPGVVEQAAELGRACAFDLRLVAPELPPFPCPDGLSEMAYLRRLVTEGASRSDRYGPRPAAGSDPTGTAARAWTQIDHELAVIEALGFPGYFLIVWDIVQFCVRNNIYCQGRGSAANSAACWALDITKADAVRLGLLFERFLSPERDGPPDIDLDIESGRREEVIQYVYDRYGRRCAAQVANVITYRSRSAVRDMAKALGADAGQQDAWSKQLDPWKGAAENRAAAGEADHEIPDEVLDLASQIEHFPRHLGIHSGGMVLCDRPVSEVCPVEWARMAGRSVLQWDKDDCAAVGLVKFDLLGLGMLTALHNMVDLVAAHTGERVDLATIPQDDEVYDMLCRADAIGVFQVESRAQMATLPRLRPRKFYDLVVEVALIRPGPIQGGSVHPYIRRRNGKEPVTYLHPLLERSLAKTLGIPLFQEQLMQMAIDVAGFSAGEADQLRQAMGSKRSTERMERLRQRFFDGMAERGITGEVAEAIYAKLAAFANFGFPESHSVSFAYLVYASAWLKLHHPAAFCAGLLNAQPMGFYSPHSLVADARRHGVEVRTPDLNASAAGATLELCESSPGGLAIRLGIGSVRGIGDELAERIAAGRPYRTVEELARAHDLTLPQLEALATSGACGNLEGRPSRREAIWTAGAVAQGGADRLAGIVTGDRAPTLPGMEPWEVSVADLWATGIAPNGHPTRFLRQELHKRGVVPASDLASRPDGSRILVAGVVTHRQRPATAAGVTFVNLEDETGLINVVVSKGCWVRHRRVVQSGPALLVRGRLECAEGVTNVVAETITLLPLASAIPSRDFR